MTTRKRFVSEEVSRRDFLKVTAAAAGASLTPAVVTAQKSDSRIVVGNDPFQFEVQHDFVELPDRYHWQTTHNIAVDRDGLIYVIHEGRADLKDHPAIFVFDSDGRYVRSFGQQFQGGGHGLEVRTEGNDQFLYVTAYQGLKFFSKLTLDGESVWERRAPMESGCYVADEATNPQNIWGRDRFMPTNIAFLDDGGFFVADGYGAWCIHQYDNTAQWVAMFGGPGDTAEQFSLPHGIWTDKRIGREPALVIADRQHDQLKWFSFDGHLLQTMGDFLLPANADTYHDLMVVPELQARITILGPENTVVARLGDDPVWRAQVLANDFELRRHPDRWQAGKFIHPHDACFDANGNILVAEWVSTGRVTKLLRI